MNDMKENNITIPKKVIFFLLSIFLFTYLTVYSFAYFFPDVNWFYDPIKSGRFGSGGFPFDILLCVAWIHVCIWLITVPIRFPEKMTWMQSLQRILFGTIIMAIYLYLVFSNIS